MAEEEPPRQPDEEIFRWHGALDIDDEARRAMEELANLEGMSFEEVVQEVLRRRYRYSQVGWPTIMGEKPYEKLPDRHHRDSLTTDMTLPSGKLLSRATEILNRSATGERIRFSTLYETPREGYKLQIEESVTKGTDVSKDGRRASRVETTHALYSEEEAKQKHPEMFENLLKRSQE